MATFVDYDPLRGIAHYEAVSAENQLQYHYRQDVEPLLDHCKALRNDSMTDKGIKQDLWHYASIPPVVILKLKYEKGIDIFKRDHLKAAFDEINANYPYLKTTDKHHDLRGRG